MTQAVAREFQFTDEDFEALRAFIRERAGIVLAPHKTDLVYGRLSRRLRLLGLRDFKSYCRFLASPQGAEEIEHAVNALTTNLTRFFRETHHFETLRREMPRLMKEQAATRSLRLWSAACSSGEEPYSIAMTVRAAMSEADIKAWDVRILGTDIDTTILAQAKQGVYPSAVQDQVPPWARDYGVILDGPVHRYAPDEVTRHLVRFAHLNLLAPWPIKRQFDAIFCRNVLIYFDQPTCLGLLRRFATVLRPGGLLFLGHSEHLPRQDGEGPLPFRSLGGTTYLRL